MSNYFERQAARQQWQQQWPNHCPACEGAGFYKYNDDPSAPGVSLAPGSMTFQELCPQCVEYDLCPRCGGDLGEPEDEAEAFTCPHCGWDSANPDSCPPNPRYEYFGAEDPVSLTLERAGLSQLFLIWFRDDRDFDFPSPTRHETAMMQIANSVNIQECQNQRELDLAVMQALRERRDALTQAIRSLELVHEPTSFAEAEALGYVLLGELRDDREGWIRRDYESPEGQFLLLTEPSA